MSTPAPHTSQARRDGAHRPSTASTVLLACGVVSSLLYVVAHEILAAALYDGYSRFDQAISELTSVGAPTRAPLTAVGFVYDVLIVAFGIGVWRTGRGVRPLRIAGVLLVAYGFVGPLWLPFPMTGREDIEAGAAMPLADTMHLVLSAVTVSLWCAMIGFAAAAFGTWFRVYSAVTVATILAFGAWTGRYVPAVAAAEPTPGMGAVERVMFGAFVLWVAVLAVVLLVRRTRPASLRGASGGRRAVAPSGGEPS
ncbi:protein of unknown function DUF998 [Rhodococcus rhodochrous ATCC 21198]|uniref:DUF998 domain-containing protein n=1 Tax=Rhodococcus aetherivorans TaxID=191292 RepID=UPI0003E24580|nr:DUF998 domain-containing protein [Rhodococcus aetherivorans]ETT23488.1 protein of unknown function DUF998 [Rhodococcus rhodochrous ATCC 21198]